MRRTILGLACLLLAITGPVGVACPQAEISWLAVPASKAFSAAVAPDALRYACADSQESLAAFFLSESLPFSEQLVTKQKDRFCHLHYEPTIRGFRAHTESDPVRGLVFAVDWRGFQGQRSLRVGDSLDIAKAVLNRITRPLEVSLRSNPGLSSVWRQRALDFHFPATPHNIELRENPAERENVWAQDYLKSGDLMGNPVVLITRNSYEGKAMYGPLYSPLLSSFESRGWIRSKLSWDGGDLQFGQDPKDPSKTILFYGDAARPYWAKTLSPKEYEWVLLREFGADRAVDLSGLAAHIDYFVAFLPDGKTALVSRRVRQNMAMSRAAIQLLQERFGPVPVLKELSEIYEASPSIEGATKDRVLRLLERMRNESSDWQPYVDAEFFRKIEAYWAKHCAEDSSACTSGPGFVRMLETEPELLKDWLGAATVVRMGAFLPRSMLALLYSQIEETGQHRARRVDAKIRELQELGFHIIEVPQFHGDVEAKVPWSGISYVNSTIVDDTIFIPAFGLGEAEEAIFNRLQAQLPSPYRLVPVIAQEVLLVNGGTHCVAGFLRSSRSSGITQSSVPGQLSVDPALTVPRDERPQGTTLLRRD